MGLEYWRVAPLEYRALVTLQMRVAAGIDPKLSALVLLRVSQINGCLFCTDLHEREALRVGERRDRIDVLPEWRRASVFSASERVALEWAECLTGLGDRTAIDAARATLARHFPETQVVHLTFSIALMNGMNRIAIGSGRNVQSADDTRRKPPKEVPA